MTPDHKAGLARVMTDPYFVPELLAMIRPDTLKAIERTLHETAETPDLPPQSEG